MAQLSAHEYGDVDDRSLSGGTSGFDGLKYKLPAFEAARTLPAKQQLPAQSGLEVLAPGIGLPEFDHGIRDAFLQPIKDPTPDRDPFPFYAIVDHHAVVEAGEGIAVLLGGEAIGKIRAHGLGRGLR